MLLTLETQWDRLDSGASEAILAEWSAACEHWGRPLRVRAPGGDVEGIAERLDTDGALVLRAGGREVRVLAGDVASAPEGARP